MQYQRPPSLSELTPIIFNMELTHLGSETSIYYSIYIKLFCAEIKEKSSFMISVSENL